MSQYKRRILVVGTTQDYIDYINKEMPNRAVFLTLVDRNANVDFCHIDSDIELLCSLDDEQFIIEQLEDFLCKNGIVLNGVTCFDCESLLLASSIAKHWMLPFPLRRTILYCRDKYLTNILLRSHGLACPRSCYVHSVGDILNFIEKVGGPVVIKPIAGTGSEFTFKCFTSEEGISAYRMILKGIIEQRLNKGINFNKFAIACEEFISGDEYSCDVYFEAGTAHILRIAKKYFEDGLPFGSVRAYEIPAVLPASIKAEYLKYSLEVAASALGFNHNVFMVDFICCDSQIYFLEMSPRPGGDCLPLLIKHSCGTDMLAMMLDLAEGIVPSMPPVESWAQLIGVKIYTDVPGRLISIDVKTSDWDENIKELFWIRHTGDILQVPPIDYSSWLLGYVIFSPKVNIPIDEQICSVAHCIRPNIIPTGYNQYCYYNEQIDTSPI